MIDPRNSNVVYVGLDLDGKPRFSDDPDIDDTGGIGSVVLPSSSRSLASGGTAVLYAIVTYCDVLGGYAGEANRKQAPFPQGSSRCWL